MPAIGPPKAIPNQPEFTADFADGADKMQPDRDGRKPMT
jgi:hypothetical protein